MWKKITTSLQNSDSIISLVIGFTMMVVIGILTYSIISSVREQMIKNVQNDQQQTQLPTTYTVKEGDNLWTIAEHYYNSGYNWVDIAAINNLIQPDRLAIGQILKIPDVSPIRLSEQGDILDGTSTDIVTPQHKEITVVEGESLWIIATREYGTGYKWIDIAQANSIITDPNLIYPNTILRLP